MEAFKQLPVRRPADKNKATGHSADGLSLLLEAFERGLVYSVWMNRADTFTFGRYDIDTSVSKIIFHYRTDLQNGEHKDFAEVLSISHCQTHQWETIPPKILDSLCQSLSLVLGISYWKLSCTPIIRIEGFELNEAQAIFWNTLYTKSLGEFFYKSNIDFRGLANFPFAKEISTEVPSSYPRSNRTLLAIGGGKDSLVSAEFLSEHNIPYDLFVMGMSVMQDRAAQSLNKIVQQAFRIRDPEYYSEIMRHDIDWVEPRLLDSFFTSLLVALLFDYKYIAFSNESSADIRNTSYLGMDINHQWEKSTEAESMVREYIHSNITPDIELFSLCRQYSEIEMTRRFAQYGKHFYAFTSCNTNFTIPYARALSRPNRAFWCNQCPKCAFIFSCMSGFVPKHTLIDIFGQNLYEKKELIPIFRQLLGLEGFKPFECVGTAEEMAVAMHLAHQKDSYNDTLAMKLFLQHFTDQHSWNEMERNVFSQKKGSFIPLSFMSQIRSERS